MVWSHRVLAIALLAFTAVGCGGPTESVPGPMEGFWDGYAIVVRPSCVSVAACTSNMSIEVHDDGGTLRGFDQIGSILGGTRDADGNVVLHGKHANYTYLGTVSTDRTQFNGQVFSGFATSVPATGVLNDFHLTRRSASLGRVTTSVPPLADR